MVLASVGAGVGAGVCTVMVLASVGAIVNERICQGVLTQAQSIVNPLEACVNEGSPTLEQGGPCLLMARGAPLRCQLGQGMPPAAGQFTLPVPAHSVTAHPTAHRGLTSTPD